MKRILLLSASAVFLLASCGPSKEEMKKTFVKSCMDGAKQEMAGMATTPQMESIMNEYCSCAGDKAIATFSKDEFKEIGKDPKGAKAQEMQKRLEPVIQPCINDMVSKMTSVMSSMQQQPAPAPAP